MVLANLMSDGLHGVKRGQIGFLKLPLPMSLPRLRTAWRSRQGQLGFGRPALICAARKGALLGKQLPWRQGRS